MSKVILFTPRRFEDNRGWFSEIYSSRRELANGINDAFVQDNLSSSVKKWTIRGIHFQTPPHAQSKLVRCARGSAMDYVVDLRRNSPTYGEYVRAEISERLGNQIYVPVGFGHAFVTLEPNTEISYKVSDFYSPDCDGGVRWDCPDIGIDWQIPASEVTVSEKDKLLPNLRQFESPFEYDGEPLELVLR